ncbi:TPA: 50S ribosomal protein L3 [Candidatus Bathyarchaeota archaeon]|nr:50S ribosomal protein L3 [Candidatus Bathyarchaeota archaeon]
MRKKWSAPRRGSLAFSPRVRAKRWVGKIRYWPEVDGEPTPLAFAGYKAGMTHVVAIDTVKNSLTYGKEIAIPVTIIETPPMLAVGFRVYEKTEKGLKALSEAWVEKPPKDFARLFPLPEKFDLKKKLEEIENLIDRISEVRLLLATQPKLVKKGRKKPELLEVKIGGGTVKERLEYAKKVLGKELRASEVFKEGQWVDVIAITKGKGFQGPVKRWGVALLHHKSRKTRRGVGSIGPWHPAFVMRTVPRAGQMGFHQRTEYNKQILKVGSNGEEVTPKGGFLRYGPIRTEYIALKGTVPGPAKRLITLRYAARAEGLPTEIPKIEHIDLESKQGD